MTPFTKIYPTPRNSGRIICIRSCRIAVINSSTPDPVNPVASKGKHLQRWTVQACTNCSSSRPRQKCRVKDLLGIQTAQSRFKLIHLRPRSRHYLQVWIPWDVHPAACCGCRMATYLVVVARSQHKACIRWRQLTYESRQYALSCSKKGP